MSEKALQFNLITYLQSLTSGLSAEEGQRLSAAAREIEEILCVYSESSEDFKEFSYFPTPLTQIFEAGVAARGAITYGTAVAAAEANPKFQPFVDMVSQKGYYEGTEPETVEYMQRHAKLIQKFNEKVSNAETEKVEAEKLAEEKKILGNTAMSSKDYAGAVQYYTEALDLSSQGPNSHIYYCNRAAAYYHLNEHADSVADCDAAIALVPDYVKAYSRLGLGHFSLGNYEEAVKAYEKAVELEPDNEGSKKSLKLAKKKAEEGKKVGTHTPAGAPAGGVGDMFNDPKFANILGSPFMKDAMDKIGGQSGLANLMKDPDTMAMAQKIMQNPQALSQVMQMANSLNGGGAGGAGGMPDLSALAGMMGGAGGAGKKGKKQPFKGFEE